MRGWSILVAALCVVAMGSCSDSDGSNEAAALTVSRLSAGPIGTEGATMVVRVLDGSEVVFEVEVGEDYERPIARTRLGEGSYRLEVAQRLCVESCSVGARSPRAAESQACATPIEMRGEPVEVVALIEGYRTCDLALRLATERE